MCTGVEIAMIASAATGLASEAGVFGKEAKEGKKVEYEAQAPEYQQEFAEEFFKYLQGQIGQGATPYGGQVAAPFVNPFTQGAYGAMQASPYGSMMGDLPMGGAPFVPPPQPPAQPPGVPPGGKFEPGRAAFPFGDYMGGTQKFLDMVRAGGGGQPMTQAPRQPTGPRQRPQPFERGGASRRMMR